MSTAHLFLAAAAGEAASAPLIGDTTWVALSFITLLGVFAWLGVHRFIIKSLDDRRESIRRELEEARALKNEAQEALARLQRRQNKVAEEAEAILTQAQEDARLLRADSEKKLEDLMSRRRVAMEQKIARAQADAIRSLRIETTEIAISAARHAMQQTLSDAAKKRIIASTLETLDSRLH